MVACDAEPSAPEFAGSPEADEAAAPPEVLATAVMPGPLRGRGDVASRENERCVDCHADEADAWETSRHKASSSNDAYRAALAIEPSPFCQGCHAPEADPRSMESDSAGVSCLTCHVTGDREVLASGELDELDATSAPHLLRRSPAFGRSDACAGCHEFRFPFASGEGDAAFMQTTVREHAQSSAADRGCASCHMPAGSHAFSNVRDPAWLRKNVSARAELDDFGVTVRVEHRAGHAFPTGDLFRRCEIGAELRGPGGEVLRRDVRYLARHFEIVPGQPGRTLVADDRVRGEPSEVTLDIRAEPGATSIVWWVTYQRVAHVGDGHDPSHASIESEVPLHSGTFLLPPLQ